MLFEDLSDFSATMSSVHVSPRSREERNRFLCFSGSQLRSVFVVALIKLCQLNTALLEHFVEHLFWIIGR